MDILKLHPNTDLCVDVKTILLDDPIAEIGKCYQGTFVHDDEDHYTLVETEASLPQKRNPCAFRGQFVTLTRRDDGTLRPNFRPVAIGQDFDYPSYSEAVAQELRQALEGLVGRKVARRKRPSAKRR